MEKFDNRQCQNNEDTLENESESDRNEGNTLPTEKENEQIKDLGSITARGKHVIHCLTIIGQIEGHYTLSSQNKALYPVIAK